MWCKEKEKVVESLSMNLNERQHLSCRQEKAFLVGRGGGGGNVRAGRANRKQGRSVIDAAVGP